MGIDLLEFSILSNHLIRKEYRPQLRRWRSPNDPLAEVGTAIREGRRTADELLRWYCTLVYTRTDSYEAANCNSTVAR